MFNEEIGTKYICNAHKPLTKNYIRAMELMGTDRSNTLFVGDQLFTDVWGAKRAGMRNILVKPIIRRRRSRSCSKTTGSGRSAFL